ncbi:MAG: hypothetical protein ACJ75B_03030 [Flavisolibacter sp.]
MKKSFTGSVLLLLSIFMLISCGSSRKSIGVEQGWDLIADKKVNFVRDKDDIPVHSRDQYTALRFKVEDHNIHISELKIYFQNGDKLEPNIDADVNAGQYSRDIELSNDGRYVDRIEFKYHTLGSVLHGRAQVLIFGRRY